MTIEIKSSLNPKRYVDWDPFSLVKPEKSKKKYYFVFFTFKMGIFIVAHFFYSKHCVSLFSVTPTNWKSLFLLQFCKKKLWKLFFFGWFVGTAIKGQVMLISSALLQISLNLTIFPKSTKSCLAHNNFWKFVQKNVKIFYVYFGCEKALHFLTILFISVSYRLKSSD